MDEITRSARRLNNCEGIDRRSRAAFDGEPGKRDHELLTFQSTRGFDGAFEIEILDDAHVHRFHDHLMNRIPNWKIGAAGEGPAFADAFRTWDVPFWVSWMVPPPRAFDSNFDKDQRRCSSSTGSDGSAFRASALWPPAGLPTKS